MLFPISSIFGLLDDSSEHLLNIFAEQWQDWWRDFSYVLAFRSLHSFLTFTGQIVFSFVCCKVFAFVEQQGIHWTFPTCSDSQNNMNEGHCTGFGDFISECSLSVRVILVIRVWEHASDCWFWKNVLSSHRLLVWIGRYCVIPLWLIVAAVVVMTWLNPSHTYLFTAQA